MRAANFGILRFLMSNNFETLKQDIRVSHMYTHEPGQEERNGHIKLVLNNVL